MIKHIRYIFAKQYSPYKNLALEEYLLHNVADDECILYLWQNQKTVVIGKNQNCWKECKTEDLEKDGGFMVRRLSGGGAVFHDLGNLNFTFLVKKENYDVSRQLDVILNAVKKLGINAQRSGRNDIIVEGKKFSGNAFYKSGDCCYHHGTLLLDVDMDNLSKYLSVSIQKLQSKGVSSVKSRVTNLIEYCPDITVSCMGEKLIEAFSEVYNYTATEIPQSELNKEKLLELTNKFSSWDWNFGHAIPFSHEVSQRFSWGDIQLQLQVNHGRITQCFAFSDAMHVKFIANIPDILINAMFSSKEVVMLMQLANTRGEEELQIKTDITKLLLKQGW